MLILFNVYYYHHTIFIAVIFYRKHDFENYLCTLLLHKSIRRTGFAVRAFNIEIATIQDQISDMKIGEMRFKFWETSLTEIYRNKIPKHPVLIELYIVSILLLLINL